MSWGDDIGHAAMLIERRQRLAERLSDAAKHRVFPTVYARPVPMGDDRDGLKAKLKALQGKLDEAKVKIRDLSTEIKRLRDENSALVLKGFEALAETPQDPQEGHEFLRYVRAIDVMGAFCTALNRYGFRVEEELWTIEHLRSNRRSRALARPRQVCMWTVTQVCKHLSLPSIGHSFGGRDHTTIMHGRDNAADIMLEAPLLGHIAREVMEKFRAGSQAKAGAE